jgi:hypothetical protein
MLLANIDIVRYTAEVLGFFATENHVYICLHLQCHDENTCACDILQPSVEVRPLRPIAKGDLELYKNSLILNCIIIAVALESSFFLYVDHVEAITICDKLMAHSYYCHILNFLAVLRI